MSFPVVITTLLFDQRGPVSINLDWSQSKLNTITRRITRTATLDGGAVIIDNGYSPSDATLEFYPFNISKVNLDNIKALTKYHSQIIIDSEYGCFLGTIKTVDDQPRIKITFLIKEQLNEV